MSSTQPDEKFRDDASDTDYDDTVDNEPPRASRPAWTNRLVAQSARTKLCAAAVALLVVVLAFARGLPPTRVAEPAPVTVSFYTIGLGQAVRSPSLAALMRSTSISPSTSFAAPRSTSAPTGDMERDPFGLIAGSLTSRSRRRPLCDLQQSSGRPARVPARHRHS